MDQLPLAYSKYELLFTPQHIPVLRDLRGEDWRQLVDRLSLLPETHPDVLAFSMLMINLDNCLTCEMDSYRAQRGCASCTRQTITSFKGSDKQLMKLFTQSKDNVAQKLEEISGRIPLTMMG